MIYQWKNKARSRGLSAQEVGSRLEDIREQHGKITTEIVLDDASKNRTFYGEYFEWNNDIASHKYREIQARGLISNIKIINEETGEDEPQYINLIIDSEHEYVPVDDAKTNPVLVEQIQTRAHRELIRWIETYEHYGEMKEIIKAVTQAITDLDLAREEMIRKV
jgi:hypothetical protein